MNDPFGILGAHASSPQYKAMPVDPTYRRHDEAMEVEQKQARLAGEARDLAAQSAAHAAQQTALLAAMRQLSEDLASERRRSAAREDIQQGFNRRMSWAALLLAGAAVIVPFGILLIEQMLR